MKSFWTLYKKELRLIRGISLAVVAVAVVANMFDIVSRNVLVLHGDVRMIGYNLLQAVMFMFPAILWYSHYTERATLTSCQSSSLPVTRYAPMTTKLAAVLTWGLLLIVVMTAFGTLRTWIMNRIGLPYANPAGIWAFRPVHLKYSIVSYLSGLFIEYWLPILYWCGVVSFAEGLSTLLTRSRLSAYVLAIAVAIVFQVNFSQFTVIPRLSLALFGLLLALAGIALYNRYAEA